MERASINFKFDKKNKVLSDFDVLHIRIGCQTPEYLFNAKNLGIFKNTAGGTGEIELKIYLTFPPNCGIVL